jgi:hypothetical protein
MESLGSRLNIKRNGDYLVVVFTVMFIANTINFKNVAQSLYFPEIAQ